MNKKKWYLNEVEKNRIFDVGRIIKWDVKIDKVMFWDIKTIFFRIIDENALRAFTSRFFKI